MKLLLDENLPKRLKEDFPDHEVYTVREMGWNGKKDVELLQKLKEHGFHALLTFDKNIRYQQNFNKATVTVFILCASNNTYATLTNLSSKVNSYLKKSNVILGPVLVN